MVKIKISNPVFKEISIKPNNFVIFIFFEKKFNLAFFFKLKNFQYFLKEYSEKDEKLNSFNMFYFSGFSRLERLTLVVFFVFVKREIPWHKARIGTMVL